MPNNASATIEANGCRTHPRCSRNLPTDRSPPTKKPIPSQAPERSPPTTRRYEAHSRKVRRNRLCSSPGVPKGVRYRTRHQLCLEMLAQHGEQLPHAWIAGDDEMGRPYWFRSRLNTLGEQYLLAVPCDTNIHDLEVDPPEYGGRGRRPQRPWMRIDKWVDTVSKRGWTKVDVRDGSKGPLIVEATKRRVVARTEKRQEGDQETLVIIRVRQRDTRRIVHDGLLSVERRRGDQRSGVRPAAAKAEHRIEECIQRSKSEAGLADYEVRNWNGWHHHQILSLIATWFLVVEARRGKKKHPGNHGSANPRGHQRHSVSSLRMRFTPPHQSRTRATSPTQRTRSPVSLETT